MVCTKKILFRTNWAILGPKMAHPHNSGLALKNFLKFCITVGRNLISTGKFSSKWSFVIVDQ